MTLHTVTRRGRVTDVKVKHSSAHGTEIVVGLAFSRRNLTDAEKAALFDYHGYAVDARMSVLPDAGDEDDDGPTPLDQELERVNGHKAERMRPLAHETCRRCGLLIGDDEDPGFYTPPAGGQPLPYHGACLPPEDEESEEDEEEEQGPVSDEQLETLLALVNLGPTVPVDEWTPEEREAAAEWAGREHLHASDNEDVERLERPAFLDEKTTTIAKGFGALDVADELLGPEPEAPTRVLPGRGRGGAR